MPAPGRIFADDEELGKKNDDHRRANGTVVIPAWSWTKWKATPRIRRRRLLVGLFVGILLYFFVKYIPTDLGPIARRIDTRVPGRTFNGVPVGVRGISHEPSGQPPHAEGRVESEKRYYNGPIMFYGLAASLHAIARTMGYRDRNKNVLFAAGNMQSASRLIPIACEMSRWNRNTVHFAVMGREKLSMDDVLMVNGVGPDCDLFWHDARPDYSVWSTDLRMEMSVVAALSHIQSFMHPQVFLIDSADSEEPFFVRGVRSKARETGRSVIELPSDAGQRLMWITRLDHGSLSAWQNVYIDIVIHAPSGSSGSLIRLLRSIEEADYFGSRRPHLTIELPPDIDPPTRLFLDNLVWPPLDYSGASHASQVTLRRRISRHDLDAEESSLKFVESFYSARPQHSHVLVLSPQVELAPSYYQYLLYNILEYRYSAFGADMDKTDRLIGISLDLPTRYLNGSNLFQPPLPEPADAQSDTSLKQSVPPAFLWQAPNSNAALYFGDFWAEFHSFLTFHPAVNSNTFKARTKLIDPNEPAWTEYLLELMRARGYSLLYPNLPSSQSIATVHNELYQPPEEVTPMSISFEEDSSPPVNLNEPFVIDPAIISLPRSPRPELPLLSAPLLTILPNNGDLPELPTLVFLCYSGEILTSSQAQHETLNFAEEFKREVGGCTTAAKGVVRFMSAEDLFCLDDDESADDQERSVYASTAVPTTTREKPETTQEFLAHLARQARH